MTLFIHNTHKNYINTYSQLNIIEENQKIIESVKTMYNIGMYFILKEMCFLTLRNNDFLTQVLLLFLFPGNTN